MLFELNAFFIHIDQRIPIKVSRRLYIKNNDILSLGSKGRIISMKKHKHGC